MSVFLNVSSHLISHFYEMGTIIAIVDEEIEGQRDKTLANVIQLGRDRSNTLACVLSPACALESS